MNKKFNNFIKGKRKTVIWIAVCFSLFMIGCFTIGYDSERTAGMGGLLFVVPLLLSAGLVLEWILYLKCETHQMCELNSGEYKKWVEKSFNSGNVTEWQLRAASLFVILKDRIFTDILPDVLEIIRKSHKALDKDAEIAVWGKLVGCGIYLSKPSIPEHYAEENATAKKFSNILIQMFCENFNETPDTIREYERKDTSMGNGQVIWALGKTVCDAVKIESAVLADEIAFSFFERICRIQMNTTPAILSMSLEDVKAMAKSVSLQHPD